MRRRAAMNLDEDQAACLRVLLSDCELTVDDELRETLLRRLTYAMHEAAMALAPDGPVSGDARGGTWGGEGGGLGAEVSDRPARPARSAAHPPIGSRRSLCQGLGRF